jgi:hypothetical protein
MLRQRRLQIIATFFIIWACALMMEMANFSLLGYERGAGSRRVFFVFVLMFGFSWQLIFQGPTRLEIMERLRRRSGYDACTIDRIYLDFNVNRTIRMIIVLLLWIGLGFGPLLHTGQVWSLSGAAAFFATIATLRVLFIRIRVLGGRFGTTQYEARELLMFLSKLQRSLDGRVEPPGRMQPLLGNVKRETIPNNAEVAL